MQWKTKLSYFSAKIGSWLSLVVGASVVAFLELLFMICHLIFAKQKMDRMIEIFQVEL